MTEQERKQCIVALAQERYGSDEIEVDDDAEVHEGDENGAFVQAWVWVPFYDTELDKGLE